MDLTCPIRSVDLPGEPDVELQGLIVVVGPNSSGKTQFIHDLNDTVCGRRRQLVVASAVFFRPPPSFDEYFNFLLERDIIRESSPDHFSKRSFQYGADVGAGSFHKSHVRSQHQQLLQAAQKKVEGSIPESAFLKELGPLSCSVLFLDNRLTLMNACSTFNYSSESPSKTLQSLYGNRSAGMALYREIAQVFQRAVWIDNTRYTQLVLRVSDSTALPPPDDRLDPAIMETYRTVETEGDGLRSYSAICATFLLERRPLCLIDEPEMCLHPPQAHAMGRFIGAQASENSCTVVATHSSHVLRGILETNPQAQVIRLTRAASTFQARKLSAELLQQATSKPRSRSEAILEGLLSDGVVLCEAEGDRIVYESTYRTLKDRRLDIRFVASEGTGGFAEPLRLYKALKVPSAVVADLDFLVKAGELRKVLTQLGTPDSQVPELCQSAQEAISSIRCCVSNVDPIAVQDELSSLGQSPIDPAKDEDVKLRGKLLDIAARLDKLTPLKQQGLDAIPDSIRESVRSLLAELQEHGLFLVPVGELESWLPIVMKGQSREDKSKWAMLAAEKIEHAGELDEDIWRFIRKVYDFLQNKAIGDASRIPGESGKLPPSLPG